ncbi:FAD:protein FMN transferase [Sinimarinibacterium sp. CAU 1509]|uniref:FAD:protein FMN transferase n=1 Tax=Sinimarinibacterium sp. CAU 1509 TaxID=2562283 RepID=UPI0010AC32A0|nr:FAD:protein FMN transferase [Sinimarinibacterium sp. CAU 1509]TJY60022.1 FAD:protein FMN transferase [Sinimarinibacterium sp. CAU 1509]
MHKSEISFRAMASPCRVCVFHPRTEVAASAAAAARDEVLRIEHKYSRYRDDSVMATINASAGSGHGIDVDDETAALLDYAATAHAQSDGLFDITSGVLRRAWDFRSGELPSQAQIDALLDCIGWHKLEWHRPRLGLPLAGMQLDFGGFGKEYAADRAAAVAGQHGIAHGLVDLGGDIRVIGPQPDGRPWRVGVRDPEQPTQAAASVDLHQGAIASSGDYERCMVVEGRRYSHLLDPRSGWPVVSPIRSVSVLAPQCLIAGTATTVALLQGADARTWLQALGLPWLTIDAQGRIDRSHDTA